jgi:hypothetical protein
VFLIVLVFVTNDTPLAKETAAASIVRRTLRWLCSDTTRMGWQTMRRDGSANCEARAGQQVAVRGGGESRAAVRVTINGKAHRVDQERISGACCEVVAVVSVCVERSEEGRVVAMMRNELGDARTKSSRNDNARPANVAC